MDFSDWITKKYIEWRGDAIGNDRSITKFSDMLNVNHSLMTQWMKKGGKVPTSQKYIALLIRHFGVEAYDALNIPRPSGVDVISLLPDEIKGDLKLAMIEIKSSGLNIDKAAASPEEVEKIRDILVKHLGKYQDTAVTER